MLLEQYRTFGEWVRACRSQRSMTQQAYAILLGYDIETLRKVERSRYLSKGFVERIAALESADLKALMRFAEVAGLFAIAEPPAVPQSDAAPNTPPPVLPPQPRFGRVFYYATALVIGILALLIWVMLNAFGQQAVAIPTAIPSLTLQATQVIQAVTASVTPLQTMQAPSPSVLPSPLPTLSATIAPSPVVEPTATYTPLPSATNRPQATPVPPTATSMPSVTEAPQLRDLPIPFTGNDDIANLFRNVVLGERLFDGVRFVISEPPNKLSTQCESQPAWPDEVTIPITAGIERPEEIYLLLNAGYTQGAEGTQIGDIQLRFADQIAPTPYALIAGVTVREWLLVRDSAEVLSPDLREVYRGDSQFGSDEKPIAGVIDMLRITIPEAYRSGTLQAIIIRDQSRMFQNSRDPCLFIVGITVRARE